MYVLVSEAGKQHGTGVVIDANGGEIAGTWKNGHPAFCARRRVTGWRTVSGGRLGEGGPENPWIVGRLWSCSYVFRQFAAQQGGRGELAKGGTHPPDRKLRSQSS